jgi:ADP-heptose:LPS heptosyltransferase
MRDRSEKLFTMSQTLRTRIRHLQALFVAVLYTIVNLLLRGLRVVLWPRRKPSDPKRICVYRIGFIGDTLCALPAIKAIREAYPSAHLTLLTSPVEGKFPGANEILARTKLVDDIQVYFKSDVTGFRNRLVFLRLMRSRNIEMWIELPQDLAGPLNQLRNMLIAKLAGARWAYGWGFVSTLKFWVQAQSEFLTFQNQVERLLGIVHSAGIATVKKAAFPTLVGSNERRIVDGLLDMSDRLDRFIAIAPGAKKKLSLWPAERFVTVGRFLVSEGFTVVVLGGSADALICRAVAEGIGGDTINLTGRTSLKESCEVLRRCLLLICNDSGVQHLSSAVGTPCISIFSSHDMPGKWYPYGCENVVLRKWVECHTCYLETCPYDNRCLKQIDADEVIATVQSKLGALCPEAPIERSGFDKEARS